VVEVPRHDEAPTVPAAVAAAPIKRVGGRLADSASAAALARLPRGSTFAPRKFVCDPRFAPHNRRRLAWTRRRRQELVETTGAVSSGVGAYLVSAGWLFAAGEFAAELAAERGDLEAFKVAAQLTQTARQHDLAAWSLAAREAQARPDETDSIRAQQAAFQRQLAQRSQGGSQ
jgi:hypothetical protein